MLLRNVNDFYPRASGQCTLTVLTSVVCENSHLVVVGLTFVIRLVSVTKGWPTRGSCSFVTGLWPSIYPASHCFCSAGDGTWGLNTAAPAICPSPALLAFSGLGLFTCLPSLRLLLLN